MSAGWRVRRAWPRDNRMDLELLGPRGELLAAVARDDRVDPVGLDDSRLPALVVPLLLDAPEVVAPELGRDHGAAPIPLGAT